MYSFAARNLVKSITQEKKNSSGGLLKMLPSTGGVFQSGFPSNLPFTVNWLISRLKMQPRTLASFILVALTAVTATSLPFERDSASLEGAGRHIGYTLGGIYGSASSLIPGLREGSIEGAGGHISKDPEDSTVKPEDKPPTL
ncbi:hypothetical protein BKA70DRAFT_1228908 [Coprinopsis sp. MPI-PUGE-AT-0042]|nr:hypothetical protein BKA70DRAFT_1228908 [Coprinopsis sp. MPI-PUGE-AT-0042]